MKRKKRYSFNRKVNEKAYLSNNNKEMGRQAGRRRKMDNN
jgi:hypothetical protein